MSDVIKSEHSPKSLPIKYKDMGDGSFAVVVAATISGSGGSSADREIIATPYRVKTAFTGASVNDTITSIRVLDVSATPSQVGDTLWYNETTQLPLATAPNMANLEPMLSTGLTAAQLAAAGLATQATLVAVQDLLGTKTTASTALPAGGTGVIGWLSNIWQGLFGVAHAATDSGNPVKVGGTYFSSTPTLSGGQRASLQMSAFGGVMTSLTTISPTGDAAAEASSAYQTNRTGSGVIPATLGYVWNGTTMDRVRGNTAGQFAQGNVASGAADAGNPVKMGGVYRTSALGLANGQRGDLQVDANGSMKVVLRSANLDEPLIAAQSSDARSSATYALFTGSMNYLLNAAGTWDRQRGDATGAWTVGNVARNVADAGNPVKIGGVYRSSPLSITAGAREDLNMSAYGAVMVTPQNSTQAADGENALFAGHVANRVGDRFIPSTLPYLWNGVSYDRAKGDATLGALSNTISSLGAARSVAAGAASASQALTTTTRRISIFANNTDMRYVIGTGAQTALATSHFIAAGERLDLNVPANAVVAALSATASTGTLEISELA